MAASEQPPIDITMSAFVSVAYELLGLRRDQLRRPGAKSQIRFDRLRKFEEKRHAYSEHIYIELRKEFFGRSLDMTSESGKQTAAFFSELFDGIENLLYEMRLEQDLAFIHGGSYDVWSTLLYLLAVIYEKVNYQCRPKIYIPANCPFAYLSSCIYGLVDENLNTRRLLRAYLRDMLSSLSIIASERHLSIFEKIDEINDVSYPSKSSYSISLEMRDLYEEIRRIPDVDVDTSELLSTLNQFHGIYSCSMAISRAKRLIGNDQSFEKLLTVLNSFCEIIDYRNHPGNGILYHLIPSVRLDIREFNYHYEIAQRIISGDQSTHLTTSLLEGQYEIIEAMDAGWDLSPSNLLDAIDSIHDFNSTLINIKKLLQSLISLDFDRARTLTPMLLDKIHELPYFAQRIVYIVHIGLKLSSDFLLKPSVFSDYIRRFLALRKPVIEVISFPGGDGEKNRELYQHWYDENYDVGYGLGLIIRTYNTFIAYLGTCGSQHMVNPLKPIDRMLGKLFDRLDVAGSGVTSDPVQTATRLMKTVIKSAHIPLFKITLSDIRDEFLPVYFGHQRSYGGLSWPVELNPNIRRFLLLDATERQVIVNSVELVTLTK